MCIRDSVQSALLGRRCLRIAARHRRENVANGHRNGSAGACLLYTSDAADERSSVDLGGRRIIKKKKQRQ